MALEFYDGDGGGHRSGSGGQLTSALARLASARQLTLIASPTYFRSFEPVLQSLKTWETVPPEGTKQDVGVACGFLEWGWFFFSTVAVSGLVRLGGFSFALASLEGCQRLRMEGVAISPKIESDGELPLELLEAMMAMFAVERGSLVMLLFLLSRVVTVFSALHAPPISGFVGQGTSSSPRFSCPQPSFSGVFS